MPEASDNRFIVEGDNYSALPISEGSKTWMVRRWKPGTSGTVRNSDYVEALITVDTTDPIVAIRAAIDRGSWA